MTSKGVLIDDEFVSASVVCWASGVRGESFAESLGVALDRGKRIKVDQHCALLGHPNVFAVGDLASYIPEGEERPLPGVAPVAMQQGRFVADTIIAELKRKPRQPFEYVDKGMMATVGRSRAVAQADFMPPLTGFIAWLEWCFVHVMYLDRVHLKLICCDLSSKRLAVLLALEIALLFLRIPALRPTPNPASRKLSLR